MAGGIEGPGSLHEAAGRYRGVMQGYIGLRVQGSGFK